MCNVSVVVGVNAELDEEEWSFHDVNEAENVIVSRWRDVSADEQHELRDKVDEILRPLGFETKLLVMRRANGIALYFICLTLSAIMSLRDQWLSRQLRDIVKKLFTLLSTAFHTVPVNRLMWPTTEYERCLDFLRPLQGKESSYILCTCSWLKYSAGLRYLGALGYIQLWPGPLPSFPSRRYSSVSPPECVKLQLSMVLEYYWLN